MNDRETVCEAVKVLMTHGIYDAQGRNGVLTFDEESLKDALRMADDVLPLGGAA